MAARRRRPWRSSAGGPPRRRKSAWAPWATSSGAPAVSSLPWSRRWSCPSHSGSTWPGLSRRPEPFRRPDEQLLLVERNRAAVRSEGTTPHLIVRDLQLRLGPRAIDDQLVPFERSDKCEACILLSGSLNSPRHLVALDLADDHAVRAGDLRPRRARPLPGPFANQ